MYTVYDENTKQSLSDIEVCNLLNDFKRELLMKEDLIQQLKNALNTDEREKYLEYRGKFIRVCEELSEANKEIAEFNQFKEDVKAELQKRYELNNHKLVFKFMARDLGLELDL